MKVGTSEGLRNEQGDVNTAPERDASRAGGGRTEPKLSRLGSRRC